MLEYKNLRWYNLNLSKHQLSLLSYKGVGPVMQATTLGCVLKIHNI